MKISISIAGLILLKQQQAINTVAIVDHRLCEFLYFYLPKVNIERLTVNLSINSMIHTFICDFKADVNELTCLNTLCVSA